MRRRVTAGRRDGNHPPHLRDGVCHPLGGGFPVRLQGGPYPGDGSPPRWDLPYALGDGCPVRLSGGGVCHSWDAEDDHPRHLTDERDEGVCPLPYPYDETGVSQVFLQSAVADV